ncbi:MAG: hypothetical protein Q8Q24_00090, partial [bacterium]|nr:hypothetical protein [bacterium]
MAEKDQEMRIGSQKPGSEVKYDIEVDKSNAKRLREIVEEIGWPTIPKVGEEASYAAWLLIQHADFDPDFQDKCLSLMKAAKKGEVLPANIAYLTDRVAVAKGEDQIFGTQFQNNKDGKNVPKPIQDIKHLEARRNEMGLEPFDTYQQKM